MSGTLRVSMRSANKPSPPIASANVFMFWPRMTMSDGLCLIGNRKTIQTQTTMKYLEELGELPAAAAIVTFEKGACACLSRRRYPLDTPKRF